jgi:hypothetical protein
MSSATNSGEAQNPTESAEVCPAIRPQRLSLLGLVKDQISTDAGRMPASTGPTGWTL